MLMVVVMVMVQRALGLGRVALALGLALMVAACTSAPAAPAATSTPSAGGQLKVAMILAGPIQDADYNAIGYQTLKSLESQAGVATAYSESVAVADAERVAREYLSSGYDVVAFHGGQFVSIVTKLAPQFPNAAFIMESAGQAPDLAPNVWNIGRKQYEPFYAVGVLAAAATRTNKIAYLTGIKQPDFIGILNSIKLAAQETNPQVEVLYSFIGDQNDPVKARSSATSQIDSGADFIISTLNLGMAGVAEAAKAASRPILLTTFTTEKKDLAPNLMVTSELYDFTPAYSEAVRNIRAGKKGGYVEMRAGRGFSLGPIANVPDQAATKARQAFDGIAQGTKQVPEIVDHILGE